MKHYNTKDITVQKLFLINQGMFKIDEQSVTNRIKKEIKPDKMGYFYLKAGYYEIHAEVVPLQDNEIALINPIYKLTSNGCALSPSTVIDSGELKLLLSTPGDTVIQKGTTIGTINTVKIEGE